MKSVTLCLEKKVEKACSANEELKLFDLEEFSDFNRKSNEVEPHLLFGRQLAAIKGVGYSKAVALSERFGRCSQLCKFLKSAPKEEVLQSLAEIRVGNAQRRFGMSVANLIFDFFLN